MSILYVAERAAHKVYFNLESARQFLSEDAIGRIEALRKKGLEDLNAKFKDDENAQAALAQAREAIYPTMGNAMKAKLAADAEAFRAKLKAEREQRKAERDKWYKEHVGDHVDEMKGKVRDTYEELRDRASVKTAPFRHKVVEPIQRGWEENGAVRAIKELMGKVSTSYETEKRRIRKWWEGVDEGPVPSGAAGNNQQQTGAAAEPLTLDEVHASVDWIAKETTLEEEVETIADFRHGLIDWVEVRGELPLVFAVENVLLPVSKAILEEAREELDSMIKEDVSNKKATEEQARQATAQETGGAAQETAAASDEEGDTAVDIDPHEPKLLELRTWAGKRGVQGASRMNKADLVRVWREAGCPDVLAEAS